mmetsp:Transcript_18008/g.55110  ORF Transcript_18008/g.55110 Transcript_18008/m.55110 type:complete len:146 (-) Transcript_18008:361-798(-)
MARALRVAEQDYGVRGIVCGWPLERSGEAGRACRRVAAFAEAIRAHGLVRSPWTFWDERFTSVRARAHLKRARRGARAVRRREDAVAAALTLQSFLSRRLAGRDAAFEDAFEDDDDFEDFDADDFDFDFDDDDDDDFDDDGRRRR